VYHETPVIGGDTETYKGKPYTFQLVSKDKELLKYTNEKEVFNDFLETVSSYPDKAIFYFHNLEFDLPILFYPFLAAFKETSFELTASNLHIEILYGKVCFASIQFNDKQLFLVDTFAYFKSSLAMLAKTFNLTRKLKKPKGLGERKYKGKEKVEFERYAMEDARITFELGNLIQGFHKKYDIHKSMSAPNLSANMFKKYIPEKQCITANPRELEDAAILSYHGGKSVMAVQAGVYKNVALYDINSAYPFAMSMLPNFLNCRYDWIHKKDKKNRQGIYNVSGIAIPNVYTPLRDHNFKEISGPFENIWFTSYELDTAIEHGFLSEYIINEGFVVQETNQKENPLKAYALYFYAKKQEATGVEREFYKLMLNSLYGKFIQTTMNQSDSDNVLSDSVYYQAGGLWNPLLATMITGFVRAYLTELEIRYTSIHSSTDSIITNRKPQTGNAIGQLSLKTAGNCLLLRQKFYLIWSNANPKKLLQYATHGYHGNLQSLFSMIRTGNRKYFHSHMTKIRESYVQKKQPFIMEVLPKSISIPITTKIDIPRLQWKDPLTEKIITL